MHRLLEKYNKEVVPALKKEFEYENVMAIPKITKVVVNIGTGRIVRETKVVDSMAKDLALMTGQTPVKTKAKVAIASFKTRKGLEIGLKVTLRGQRMYDFMDRLVNIVLPRTRDFRGIKLSSVDKFGNLTMGIKEHIVFPEVVLESSKNIFGMGITVVSTAKTKEEAEKLFRLMGFPLAK